MGQVSSDLEILKSAGIKPKVVVGVVGNVAESRIYLDRKKVWIDIFCYSIDFIMEYVVLRVV